MHSVHWEKRSFFAEIAEALGVTTDSIMAASPQDGDEWMVLYTDEPTDDPEAWIRCGVLYRDKRNIMRVRSTRTTSQIKDFHEKMKRRMGGA